ncbi:diguanylate cyclase [Photobacterium japonica]|uniref:CHASE domain-containing protein n=1 Tax=Photobacterium japonica TaxID=2910235 RepID=UPI003D12869F
MIRRLYSITVCAVVIGIILACVLFRIAYQLETTHIQRDFEREVDKKADSLSQSIDSHIRALHSLKFAYEYQGVLTRDNFAALAQQVMAQHSPLQALAWVPWVSAAQRTAYEASAAQVLSDYHFTERVASGDMVTATERADYYPLHSVAPLAGNEAALGYDLGSNALQRTLLNQARDSGALQLSARVERGMLPQTDGSVQLVLPVYRQVEPLTRTMRRQTLEGFILGYIRLSDIMPALFPAAESSQMHYRVMDLKASSDHAQLYSVTPASPSVTATSPVAITSKVGFWLGAEKVTRTVLAKGGREWVIEALPTHAYFDQRRTAFPLYVFVGVLLLFSVLAYYGRILMHRHQALLENLDAHNQQLSASNKKLERLTRMDALVGVANRRFFDETLMKEFSRASRDAKPLALLLIDIDHFKAFNDTYGHQAGDRCLKLVASELERVLRRPADMLARVGGEEFGVILPNTNNGEVVARQCRMAVERLGIAHGGSCTSDLVTISIGVVSLDTVAQHTTETIYELADNALYEAKSSGRNMIRATKIKAQPQPTAVLSHIR